MAASEARIGRLRVYSTVLLALILAIVPLPHALDIARPELLLLLVIYWSLSAPRIAGLMFAWLSGLLIDVLKGTTLGQHALAFLLVGYFTHKFQLRMRIFPIWHQTLTVFMLLAVYQFLIFWTDGILGQPITTWARWLPVLTSTVLWPALVAALDTWNRKSR
ncbi:MAG TPA: rod shape-determining protein MreD [Steroidobacteraceae bacterium]|jgi:rod shape-determining protein MreD